MDWQPQVRANAQDFHTLLFVTQERNVGQTLTQRLMSVSDPDSHDYGNHLTFDQVGKMTSNPNATNCVLEYLREIGATVLKTSPHGNFIRATHRIQAWETVLATTFHHYHHQQRPSIVRTSQYTLPEALSHCVSFIGYTSQLPATTKPLMKATTIEAVENKPGTVDPNFLKSFYNIDSFTSSPNVSQAVFEAVGANYSPQDLQTWLGYYSFPEQHVSRDIGGHNSSALCKTTRPAACIEANLDLQYLMGTAQGSPTTYWYEANETWVGGRRGWHRQTLEG